MREISHSNQRLATVRTAPDLLLRASRSAAAAPRLSSLTSTGTMFNGKLPAAPHKPARWATENKIVVAEAAFLLKYALKFETQLTAKAKARALTRASSAPRLNELARTRAVLGAERRYQPAAMTVYEGESGEISHAALEVAWHGARRLAARQEMERRDEERRATERATYGVGLHRNPRLAGGSEQSLAARPGAADPAADVPPGPSLVAGRRPAPAHVVSAGPPHGASSRAGLGRHSSAISAGALRPGPMSSPAILQVARSPARKYVTPGRGAAMESEAREQACRIRARNAAAFLNAPSTPAVARMAAWRKAEVAQWKRQQAEVAEAELVRRALSGETARARHARAILYHTSRERC